MSSRLPILALALAACAPSEQQAKRLDKNEPRRSLVESPVDIVASDMIEYGDPLGVRTFELRDGTQFVVIGTDDDAQWTVVLRRAKGEAAWTREHMQRTEATR